MIYGIIQFDKVDLKWIESQNSHEKYFKYYKIEILEILVIKIVRCRCLYLN